MNARRLFCTLVALLCLAFFQQWACAPQLCQGDSDCLTASPERPYCHYAKCKACIESSHCQGGQACVDGVCLRGGEVSPDENVTPDDASEPVLVDGREPSVLPEDTDDVSGEMSRESSVDTNPEKSNVCPASCRNDDECSRCAGKSVCFQDVCVAPSCPSDCTEDSHCQLCGNNFKACDVEPECTDPGGCLGQCVDPTCRSYCTQDADCSGCSNGANLCNIDPTTAKGYGSCSRFKCPENCNSDKDCTACDLGNICEQATQTCSGWSRCKSDIDCKDRATSPRKPYCLTSSGVCFECKGHDDCTNKAKPICDATSRTCVACLSDSDCVNAPKNKCYKAKKVCVECLEDSDCKAGGGCFSNVCKAKAGHLCDTTGKIAPANCETGVCTFVPGLGQRQTYCYQICNLTTANCPAPLRCVQTSTSTSMGHCLRVGCDSKDDCSPAFPSFECRIFTDKRGKVCAPPLVSTAGSKKLGELCDPQASLCSSGLVCLSVGSVNSGYCTRSCRLSDNCGKFISGETMKCLPIHGELLYCGAECSNPLSCPQGMRCATRPKGVCVP